MRIYSKKAYRFLDENKQEAPVSVQALSFATVPDWVSGTRLFGLATKEESVSVIDSAAAAADVERAAADKVTNRGKPRVKAGEWL